MEKRKNLVLAKIGSVLLKALKILSLVAFILGLIIAVVYMIVAIIALARFSQVDSMIYKASIASYTNMVIRFFMWPIIAFLLRYPISKIIEILDNYKEGKPYKQIAVDNTKNVAFWIIGLGFGVISISLLSLIINCIYYAVMGHPESIITDMFGNLPVIIKDISLILIGFLAMLSLSMVLKNRPIEE